MRDFLSGMMDKSKATSLVLRTAVEEKLQPPEKELRELLGDFEKARSSSDASTRQPNVCFAFKGEIPIHLASKHTELGLDHANTMTVGGSPELWAAWSVRTTIILASLGYQQAEDSSMKEPATKKAHAWLLNNLGDYRFERVDREYYEDCFAYEFVHADNSKKRIVAVWKPEGKPHITRLYNDPFKIVRAEQIPLGSAPAESVEVKQEIEGYMAFQVGDAPILIWLEE